MRNENNLRQVLLLSAIIALLLLALIFDVVVTSLQVQNSQGAGLESLLVILFPLFALLLVLGGMGVFWYLFTSGEHSRLVGWAFLLVGWLILFSLPLIYFLPVPPSLYVVVEFTQPGTHVFQVSAQLAVIGILRLVLKPKQTTAKAGNALTEEPVELEE